MDGDVTPANKIENSFQSSCITWKSEGCKRDKTERSQPNNISQTEILKLLIVRNIQKNRRLAQRAALALLRCLDRKVSRVFLPTARALDFALVVQVTRGERLFLTVFPTILKMRSFLVFDTPRRSANCSADFTEKEIVKGFAMGHLIVTALSTNVRLQTFNCYLC